LITLKCCVPGTTLSSPVHSSSTNDKRLDHIRVNIMQFNGELASIRKYTGLGSFGYLSLVGWSWTAVAKHAFEILTNAAIGTRRHTCNKAKSSNLAFTGVVIVCVCASRPPWAF